MKQLLLFAIATVDVELQANVLSSAAGADILHQAMMTFENAVDLVADLLDARTGDFIAREQNF